MMRKQSEQERADIIRRARTLLAEIEQYFVDVASWNDHSTARKAGAIPSIPTWMTGAPEEWVKVGPGVFQNRRCSHVFKEDGRTYDSEGRGFREPDGTCYTSFESRVPIEFPYTPERTYVDVDADDGGSQGAIAGTDGVDGARTTATTGDRT